MFQRIVTLLLLSMSTLLSLADLAQSQSVVADESLGTRVGLDADNLLTIRGGRKRGVNLFHSFTDFSLGNENIANFVVDKSVKNIFSRITGKNPSNINGVIKIDSPSKVDFFLINPAGINFNWDASLNLSGSFFATTASGILFSDRTFFSAYQQAPLLTDSLPQEFRFRGNAGLISTEGSSIFDSASPEAINLVGSSVNISNALDLTSLDDSPFPFVASPSRLTVISTDGSAEFNVAFLEISGDLSVSSYEQARSININEIKNALTLTNVGAQRLSDINYRNSVFSTKSADLRGRDISLSGSLISLGRYTPTDQDDSLVIAASRLFELNRSNIETVTDGLFKAADISISADSLSLFEASIIESISEANGTSGNLSVTARNISVVGSESENSVLRSLSESSGDSGQVTIKASNISLQDGGQISATNFGTGNSGRLIVTGLKSGRSAKNVTILGVTSEDENALMRGVSGIFSQSESGQAGSVFIEAKEIIVDDKGQIFAKANDGGIAGNVTFIADQVTIANGSEVSVTSLIGPAGNLVLSANQLILDNGAITAETGENQPGSQKGANIILNIENNLQFSKSSRISAAARNQASGGNILIINTPVISADVPQLNQDGNDIVASATQGQGGNILINAQSIPDSFVEREARAGNTENNIDATGAVPGFVDVDTVTELNQGLIELPKTVIDPDSLIAQNPCSRGSESEYTLSGRGGLPVGVKQPLDNDQSQVGFISPTTSAVESPQAIHLDISQSTALKETANLPAQGWVYDQTGKIQLIAYQNQVTPEMIRKPRSPQSCSS